ncbi:hypothetical protein HK098_006612 [Nowakowskiella sp. JEL0407]|nr:hypothetical protein HK098_006612 [Nowakowskiella sp. JEL0407]
MLRLLNAGWAHCDALLVTGRVLRDEPDAQCRVVYDDLVEYRRTTLRKNAAQPLQIILTNTGDVNLKHKLFTRTMVDGAADQNVMIVTNERAAARLRSEIEKEAIPNLTLYVAPCTENGEVDLSALCSYLREDLGIKVNK